MLSFLYVYSDHSILECYNPFSGVELSMRSFFVIIKKMDKKFKQIYYSDGGYWRGKSAIQRLAKASGSMKEEAEKWLLKQPLYQIYLPAPKYIPRPNASMSLFAKLNDIHQSDLLSLLHNKFKKKTYK